MTRGDLPGLRVLGRPFKPVVFGLVLTMVIVAQANLRGVDRGAAPPLSWIVAAVSLAVIVCMTWGWLAGRQRLAECGLLLVVGAYMARAVFIWLESAWDQAVFFSLATVVIAGGSYALEVSSDDQRWGRSEG